ncbi:MAG: hypothetical protein IJV76_07080 [Clostridia bacterium]|nr:hypothetical protein [Clostridia bacterium]
MCGNSTLSTDPADITGIFRTFSVTVRAEKSFPTDAGDRKIRLETVSEKADFFQNHEITPDFRKIADFHLVLHPFWEVGFVKIPRFPKSIHKKERRPARRNFPAKRRKKPISNNSCSEISEKQAFLPGRAGFPQSPHPLLLLLLKTY